MLKLSNKSIIACAVILIVGAGCADEPVNGPTLVAADSADGHNNDGGADGKTGCDDQNLCTIDSVDPVSGKCVNTPVPDATTCDDGNKCTSLETCQAGQCVQGIDSGGCNDNNPCTTDNCNPKDGKCVHGNNDNTCDDGNSCTSGDMCKGGGCVPGAALDCDDKNVCTTDTCEGKMGGCKNGNVNCDDKNDCTMDSCDTKTGCANKPKFDGAACEDGDQCTSSDMCKGGSCKGGTAPTCDDKNVCTNDSCSPAQGCLHAPLTGQACDDGNGNTVGDQCAAGVCVGGAPSCDDKNACTVDTGDPANGVQCTNVAINCDDGKACTTDKCVDTKKGCVSVNNSAQCDDGDACSVGEKCSNGVCAGGVAPACNDSNPCTSDTCDPKAGCVFTPLTGVACNDSDSCTTNDQCSAGGICTGGPAPSCDDGNVCTTDACDPASGCKKIGLTGTGCDDKNPGTVNDACSAGICKGSSAACDDSNACTVDGGNFPACTHAQVKCDDSKLCTDDTCAPATGCVFMANAVTCDDGNVCTVSDVCASGTCGGTASKCDDGDLCTTDSCDKTTGKCGSVAIPGCGIGEICGNGIDDDKEGKIDCDDSECGPKSKAFVLFVSAQYDKATVGFVTADKPNVVQSLPAPPGGKGYQVYCEEVPFTATLSTPSIYGGTLQAWVQGPLGNTPDEKVASAPASWAFEVFWPLPASGQGLKTKSFSKPQGDAFMIAWPPSK